MNAKPMLGAWEVPRLSRIRTAEHRSFVELEVPGRVGSLYQDMNCDPTRVILQGSLHGDELRNEFLRELRDRYRSGEPVTFVADILTATELQYVVIESMLMTQHGERPDEMDYSIVLRESPPPPPPSNPAAAVESGLAEGAAGFLDSATNALDLIESAGSIPALSDPTPPLTTALDGVVSATKGLESALTPLSEVLGAAP